MRELLQIVQETGELGMNLLDYTEVVNGIQYRYKLNYVALTNLYICRVINVKTGEIIQFTDISLVELLINMSKTEVYSGFQEGLKKINTVHIRVCKK